jgi:hypothetical protein
VIEFYIRVKEISFKYKDVSPSQIRDDNHNYYIDVKYSALKVGLIQAQGMSNYHGIHKNGTIVEIKCRFIPSDFSIAEGTFEWLDTAKYLENGNLNEMGRCALFFDIKNKRLIINFFPSSSLSYSSPYSGYYQSYE